MRRRVLASGSVALLVLLLGCTVWYGTRREEVTIARIDVSGGETVSHEAVRTKVESALSGTYALLIPHRFTYLFPRSAIAEAVNAIPRVHGAAVVRSSRTALSVTYDEYIPAALWCAARDLGEMRDCVFVDQHGYAFDEAPRLMGETLVRFVVEGRPPVQYGVLYDAQTLGRYLSFADALVATRDARVVTVTETADGDLMLQTNNRAQILIRKDADMQDVLEIIDSIFINETFAKRSLRDYLYIDLRFGNKVFLKEPDPEAGEAAFEDGANVEDVDPVHATTSALE